MIKMIPMVCPRCGATIDVQKGTKTCYCTYCGTKILVSDDNNKTYTKNININRTSYNRTEIEKIKLQHDLEWHDFKISLLIIFGIGVGFFIFALICFLIP